jgi:rhodanese-related sulfurtransferase
MPPAISGLLELVRKTGKVVRSSCIILKADIQPKEFTELQGKGGLILDVRAPEEMGEGFIPEYQMIDFNDPHFRSQIEGLDRSKTYLIYCRSGNRSGKACAMMKELGFEQVYNLEGGIKAWNRKY